MHDSFLLRPCPETWNISFAAQRDLRVLMPAQSPVHARTLVEQNRTHCNGTITKRRTHEGGYPRIAGQFAAPSELKEPSGPRRRT